MSNNKTLLKKIAEISTYSFIVLTIASFIIASIGDSFNPLIYKIGVIMAFIFAEFGILSLVLWFYLGRENNKKDAKKSVEICGLIFLFIFLTLILIAFLLYAFHFTTIAYILFGCSIGLIPVSFVLSEIHKKVLKSKQLKGKIEDIANEEKEDGI